MATADFASYPNDRHTRFTATQRERVTTEARTSLARITQRLEEVCDDFAANGYRLTTEERAEWSRALKLLAPLEQIQRDNFA